MRVMAKRGSEEWKENVSASLKGIQVPHIKGKCQSSEHIAKKVESHARAIEARGSYKGVSKSGSNNQRAVLNEQKVIEIVELVNLGTKRKDVAIQYGVSPSTISDIMTGAKWSGTTGIAKKEKVKQDDSVNSDQG
jgi:DNA-binding NarL/FixJ family response regulator